MTAPQILNPANTQPTIGQQFWQGVGPALQLLQQGQERQLQRTMAGAELGVKEAGVQQEQEKIAIAERQAAANEAFRRGYANYLESRGAYYRQRAEDAQQQDTALNSFLNNIKDPDLKQKAQFIAGTARLDPRVAGALVKLMSPDQAQQGHQMVLASNIWLHSGGKLNWGQASQMAGLPVPGDSKLAGLTAPPTSSMLRGKAQDQLLKLTRTANMLKARIDQATRDIATHYKQLSGTPLGIQALNDPAAAKQLSNSVGAYTKQKWPQMDQWTQQYNNIVNEATGMVAPQLGGASGAPQMPVIPDTFGPGASDTTGGTSLDLNRLNDLIDQQSDLFDQLGATGGIVGGPGS